MKNSPTTGLHVMAGPEVLCQYEDRIWRSCGRRDRTNNEGVQMEKGSCVEGQGWPTTRAGFLKRISNEVQGSRSRDTQMRSTLILCWEGNFLVLFDSSKLYIGST